MEDGNSRLPARNRTYVSKEILKNEFSDGCSESEEDEELSATLNSSKRSTRKADNSSSSSSSSKGPKSVGTKSLLSKETPLADNPKSAGGRSKPTFWTKEEDQKLRDAVKECKESNWKLIANKVGSRNHMQCLQRWMKVLAPGLIKGPWTKTEDMQLIKLVKEGHKNWGSLALKIPGRTSKQCRER